MGTAAFEIAENLRSAASDTLENLAFTEITPREKNILDGDDEDYRGSRISLGTLGTMDLIIGRDLLAEIAVVLFNPPDGNVEPDMLADTLSEILNIIAGRFLEGVFKGKSDFSLGLPEIHLDTRAWNTLPLRTVLVADGGMELAIGMNPEANAA